MPVTRDQKDAEQSSLIAHYLELVKPIASKEIGQITTDVKKDPPLGSTNGESQLGDLIADAQLADDSTVTNGKTPVIAFMNPGGIRTDLNFAQTNRSTRTRSRATSPTRRRSRSSRSTTSWSRWT